MGSRIPELQLKVVLSQGEQSVSVVWKLGNQTKLLYLCSYKGLYRMGSLPLLKLLRVTCMEAAFFRGVGNNHSNKTSVSTQLSTLVVKRGSTV